MTIIFIKAVEILLIIYIRIAERIIKTIWVLRTIVKFILVDKSTNLIKEVRRHREQLTSKRITEKRIKTIIRMLINTLTDITTTRFRETEELTITNSRLNQRHIFIIILWSTIQIKSLTLIIKPLIILKTIFGNIESNIRLLTIGQLWINIVTIEIGITITIAVALGKPTKGLILRHTGRTYIAFPFREQQAK